MISKGINLTNFSQSSREDIPHLAGFEFNKLTFGSMRCVNSGQVQKITTSGLVVMNVFIY